MVTGDSSCRFAEVPSRQSLTKKSRCMLFGSEYLCSFSIFSHPFFSGAKCSIAAVSSGLPPLFHSMEFLLPAFLRTADPGLLFFQENSFCTFLIHRFYRLYGKNSCHPPTFSSGFFLSSYRVPDMLQDTDNSSCPEENQRIFFRSIRRHFVQMISVTCFSSIASSFVSNICDTNSYTPEPQCELLILALRRQIIIHGHIIFHGIKNPSPAAPAPYIPRPQCPVERRVHIKCKGLHRFIKRNSRLSILIAQAVQFLDIIKKETVSGTGSSSHDRPCSSAVP